MKTKLLLLMMVLLTIGTARAQKTTSNGVVYTLNKQDHTATISESTNDLPEDVTIPASITVDNAAYSVTAIAPQAFEKRNRLKSIQLPGSLKEIGRAAFRDCDKLTGITIPNGVTRMQVLTFSLCHSLATVNLPDEMTSIENQAFQGCIGLKSIKLPSKLKSIGAYAFTGCAFSDLTIPGEITSIGDGTFSGCTELKSIKLPASLTAIGAYAFDGCTGFTGFTIPEGVTSIGPNAFSECSRLKSIKLPSKLKTIEAATFAECPDLTDITIPDGVTRIDALAFSRCTKLTSIKLPSKLDFLGQEAFSHCTELTNIIIPAATTIIGEFAFEYCYSLKSITVAKDNQAYVDIEGVVFNKAKTSLIVYPIGRDVRQYAIPQGVISIRKSAFYASDILASIEIPASVTIIEEDVFTLCNALTNISISGSNSIYASTGGVLFNKDRTILHAYPCGKEDSHYQIPEGTVEIASQAFYSAKFTSVDIPSTVTSIGESGFERCKDLASLQIPDGVTRIGAYAFNFCTSLRSINIPNGITTIGNYTFNCTGLTSISIPANVTTIGERAFNDRLTSIYCAAQTPPTISGSTFANYTPVLYVSKGCQSAYRSAQYWQNFTEIKEAEADISAVRAENGIIYSGGHLTLPGNEETAQITIYTPSGTPAADYQLAPGQSCDLTPLPAGIYIIKVKAGEKTMSTKIIK